VDSCVLWPVVFTVSILLAFRLPPVLTALLVIVQSFAWLVYTVWMHARYGQTIGKMACKVKVVDYPTEQAIGARQAILRESIPIVINMVLVGYHAFVIITSQLPYRAIYREHLARDKVYSTLLLVPFLWFVAEAITMLSNRKRRALHDFIAGTVVIRTNIR
jgi:uncharacterized RDD family membrane protein YckC